MKKIILSFVFTLVPFLSSHSQIKTGGGADYPAEDSFPLVLHKIVELETHLIKRDAICANGERFLKEGDLMQTYLKLSLFKKPKATQNECDEINRYFACLNDSKTEDLLTYLQKPNATVLLMTKHKISADEAKEMVKFFSGLGEKVK